MAALFGVAVVSAKADDIDLSQVDRRVLGDNPLRLQAVPKGGLYYNGVCVVKGRTQLVRYTCDIDECGSEKHTLILTVPPVIKG